MLYFVYFNRNYNIVEIIYKSVVVFCMGFIIVKIWLFMDINCKNVSRWVGVCVFLCMLYI